jgi:hypothetical protein
MGDFGVLASRYHANARLLEDFDEAFAFLKKNKALDSKRMAEEIRKLLVVLEPIRGTLFAHLSNTLIFDDSEVVSILRQRHTSNWQGYQKQIVELIEKLGQIEIILSPKDWEMLNDIADALNTRCTHLLRRMGGR